jgi:Putative transposase/Transposase zinc-binding domain
LGAPTVIGALRRFLPEYLSTSPVLSPGQWRAVQAILHCRTPAMGGQVYGCRDCGEQRFAWHSCNHKACPQCGADATAKWVQRQLERRVNAPHFMVTFTLPDTLREMFHGVLAKQAYDIFFKAAAAALEEALASPKSMGAANSGFTMILHTWNQKLLFHPHLHCMVPGAGLDADGKLVKVRNDQFLAPLPILRAKFRQTFRREMESAAWRVDPAVWKVDWGVHVQPCGDGAAAVKYLGAYVAKSAISDARMVAIDNKTVTFRWKDRGQGNAVKVMTVDGIEFVRRYLFHALPKGLRSIRYHGYHHPAAKKNRERVHFLAGGNLVIGEAQGAGKPAPTAHPGWLCPCCGKAMWLMDRIPKPDNAPSGQSRAPPEPCAA